MIVGYHGTLETKAKIILSQQKFYHSKNDNEWLGEGVYFFKYKKHAIWWANKKSREEKDEPSLLCADLIFTEYQLLDLDNPDHLQHLKDFMSEYFRKFPDFDNTWEKYSPCQRWCISCNLYKALYNDIKVICRTFGQFTPKDHSNGNAFSENKIQYCITDDDIIQNIRKEEI